MQFENILDGMDIGLVVLDRAWRFAYVNDPALRILGKQRTELIGRNIWNTYPELTGTTFETNFRKAMDGRSPSCFDTFFPALNLWFDVYAYPVDEGIAIRYSDITGRRKEEEALRESEKGFANIFNASPAPAVIIRRKDGAYIEVNRAFEAASGFSRAEVIGKLPEEFSVFPDRALRDVLLREVAQKGAVFNREFVLQGKGGRKIISLVSIISLTFRKQECFLFIGIEITERKKAEDTLRRNEYELRTLVDNTPDIIFRLNRAMQYVYVNPAYERVTGIAKDQFIGRTNAELGMAQALVDLWQKAAQYAFESGRDHQVEFEISSFFGNRYFSARLIPDFERTGVVGTVLVIARDITDQKRCEKEIASLKR